MSEIRYSVVIPVYNSTTSLVELMERLERVFTETVRESFEVVMVDDASPHHETWQVMLELAQGYHNLTIVQLMRNFGKTGAVLCGFEYTCGDYVLTIDDDLQQLPEDIPLLIEKNNHDVVIGTFPGRQDSWFRTLTSRIKGWFDYQLLGKPPHIQITPLKLYKSQVVRSMMQIKTPHPFMPALLFYVTKDVVGVDVHHAHRKYGRSHYTFFKRLKTFSNLLINNSSFLLRLVAVMGISVSIISFVLGVYFILKNIIYGIPVPGWTSLIVVTLFSNGLILFSVGIMGEYFIRIINGVELRPAYIVRQSYHQPEDNAGTHIDEVDVTSTG